MNRKQITLVWDYEVFVCNVDVWWTRLNLHYVFISEHIQCLPFDLDVIVISDTCYIVRRRLDALAGR
jgi:hypothetical protein